MQTLEFTRALKEIVEKMRVNELIATLGKWLASPAQPNQNPPLTDQDKSQFSALVFDSYAGYASLLSSERTRRILEGLDVKDFYDPNRLRILVSAISGFAQMAQVRALAEAHAFFEKLRSLQKLEVTCLALLETEKVGKVEPEDGIVALELVDYDGKGIEPERLKLLAATVRQLHTNLARIHGIEGDQLRFKYFDSGSPVLIGIQCAKEIAESINKAMLEWWDKIRFAPFEKFDRKMESMSKGMGVMETVKQKVESKVFDEETGKILARHVLKELNTLVGIGATVPLEADATVDQRGLLLAKRDVKLLESGEPPSEPADDEDLNDPLKDPGRRLKHVE
jgi:hypothetical protein